MPTTIAFIAKNLEVSINGPVRWGKSILSVKPGVYIVCQKFSTCSPKFDINAINDWLLIAPSLSVGSIPHSSVNVAIICNELLKFWIPDESILYVGRSEQIRRRVYQYYGTPLGAKGPHHGGYWIKTLASLCTFYIYWIEDADYINLEKKVIKLFSSNVSKPYRNTSTFWTDEYLPFANLKMPGSKRKKHLIKHPY